MIVLNTVAIRGATNIYRDEETEIIQGAKELLLEIISKNNLDLNNIISVIFTATRDITKAYPAIAAREIGLNKAALMCLNEMEVQGSMEKCLRVMILYNGHLQAENLKHIYLKDTVKLRPDLV